MAINSKRVLEIVASIPGLNATTEDKVKGDHPAGSIHIIPDYKKMSEDEKNSFSIVGPLQKAFDALVAAGFQPIQQLYYLNKINGGRFPTQVCAPGIWIDNQTTVSSGGGDRAVIEQLATLRAQAKMAMKLAAQGATPEQIRACLTEDAEPEAVVETPAEEEVPL